MDRQQAVAQRQPAETEPLRFALQIDIVGSELVLELALEIVEQIVPPHDAKLATLTDMRPRLSTAQKLGRGQERAITALVCAGMYPQRG